MIYQKQSNIVYSKQEKILHDYYQKVKTQREITGVQLDELKRIFELVRSNYPNDWLLILEIFELLPSSAVDFKTAVKNHLNKLSQNKAYTDLIQEGLALL